MIAFGSHSQKGRKVDADGLFSDKGKQNLWVYTADCIPIFFADKSSRNVAALHCGRKGLEKKIIKNLVTIFDNLGTSRDDLLVALGPAISNEHYLVDKNTLKEFYRKAENKKLTLNLLVILVSLKKDSKLSSLIVLSLLLSITGILTLSLCGSIFNFPTGIECRTMFDILFSL